MSISEIATTTSAILQGLGTVLTLFFVVLVASLPLGFLMTLGTRSRVAPLRWIINAYIYVMRGTPLMLQLFFIYYGLPFVNDFFKTALHSAMVCALIGFSLNYAAYFAEIFRGGLLSIDRGQYEACQVLGLNKIQTTFHVILPQMIRVALPSITNESITLVKDTALVFAISITEILYYAKAAVTRTGNVFPYVIAFVIYLAMNTVLQLFFNWLEKKMAY
ncbi:amino acid ABC transporter permease [Anaerotruncus massiliensis (ex Liu et al. 2021)]|uniref:Amino acid ABC transporter permease n=2 Tax=Anaerotruncus TaxID=244127 RepID=A0A498D4L4_9FIRM|nr:MULTISPECIES: amino acid ABC transporter permease [Anaerotruncus]MBC3937483.1 amino acid ABC transporter permease [Anaerotruncus massiliensis (ex Togo et al. 2019)]RLL14601.1 amino acid ABC transporter permease [Anaerotruncus massiliensis (ex Liu et al. 2021)]